jgi:hypothetical protein
MNCSNLGLHVKILCPISLLNAINVKMHHISIKLVTLTTQNTTVLQNCMC